jgi:hypothetical protein
MRVRLRRFSGLPEVIEESRKTESVKVSDGERVPQRGAMRQSPRAMRTAHRLCKLPNMRGVQ